VGVRGGSGCLFEVSSGRVNAGVFAIMCVGVYVILLSCVCVCV